MVKVTADAIRTQFKSYYTRQQTRVFHPDDSDELRLTDETIFAIADTLGPWRILGRPRRPLLAKAFQIFGPRR